MIRWIRKKIEKISESVCKKILFEEIVRIENQMSDDAIKLGQTLQQIDEKIKSIEGELSLLKIANTYTKEGMNTLNGKIELLGKAKNELLDEVKSVKDRISKHKVKFGSGKYEGGINA